MVLSTSKNATARQVEMIVRQLDTLSTLPQVAGNALRLLTGPAPKTAELIEMIEADPALSVRILSIAGRQDRLGDQSSIQIEQAVMDLSAEQLRDAVLSVRVFQAFDMHASDEEDLLTRQQLALHALATACAARRLAQTALPEPLRSMAFSAGLLHDLGKLALLEVMPRSFLQMVRQAQTEGTCLTRVEQQHLGLDHTTLGRRLAEKWGLPKPLQTAIWLHHSDTESIAGHVPFIELARVVHLADLLARKAEIGRSGSYDSPDEALLLASRLHLSEENTDKLLAELPDLVRAKTNLLGLETPAAAHHYYGAIQQTAADLARDNVDLSETSRQFHKKSRQIERLNEFLAVITNSAVSVLIQTDLGDPAVCCFTIDRRQKHHTALLQLPQGQTLAARQEREEFTVTLIDPSVDWLFDKMEGRLSPACCYMAPLSVPGMRIGRVLFEIRDHEQVQSITESLKPLCQTAASLLQAAAVAERHLELSERFAEVLGNLRQARRQLAQTEALHGVAEMAAGAAHELNNPLSVISGRAQLLASSEPDPKRQEELKLIQQRTAEMSDILKDLMSYARPRQPEKHLQAAADLVHQAIDQACKIHGLPEMAARIEGMDSLPDVYVDAAQVVEAMANILLNSLQSYPGENGPIRIVRSPLQGPNSSSITISDQGCGMDQKTLANATRPFFSAPSAGRRRGMGLARAQRLLQINDGSLIITSRPGKGTSVMITLPGA
jgi:signal transduction histidine kinase/HD-like signal output (HDOD) protein